MDKRRNVSPTDPAPRRGRLLTLSVAGLVIAAGLGVYLSADEPAPKSVPVEQASISPPATVEAPGRTGSPGFAVAQRQGRCRALAYHLRAMAEAADETTVEAKRRAMGMLAGEMMNSYSVQIAFDPASNALPTVTTSDGRRGLAQARDTFRETLREVEGMNGSAAAAKVSQSCAACHARFVRDGGMGTPLLHSMVSQP